MKESLIQEKMREHARQKSASDSKNRKKRNLSHLGKSRRGKRLMTVLFLWIVFFGVVGYVGLFSFFLRIESFEVSGLSDVSEDAVRSVILSEIRSKYLWIIPKDTFLLIPEERLRFTLLERFPKLSSVSFERRFPNSLSLVFSERDRILLYCSGGPCSLVSDDGTLRDARFAEAEENYPFTIFIVDESGKPASIGLKIFSEEHRELFLRLERSLRQEFPFGVSNTVFTPALVSDEYRFTTSEGWELLVSLSVSPEKTLSSLRALIENELPSEKREKLRYIDLRAETRIFYAMKEEASAENESSELFEEKLESKESEEKNKER